MTWPYVRSVCSAPCPNCAATSNVAALTTKAGLTKNPKGKTPVATLGAQMAVANKHERHVERTSPGKYQLRK